MNECPRPKVDYPCRVPLKVIGHASQMETPRIVALILAHLGPQSVGDLEPSSNVRGPYLSLTFWVTLPHGEAEAPLRQALAQLPGVVMQL